MQITTILVAPEREPVAHTVENDLAGLQAAVGGYIQVAYPEGFADRKLCLVCNEDGQALGLAPNRRVPGLFGNVVGTFLLAATAGEEFVSLTPEQMAWALREAKAWVFFKPRPAGVRPARG
jgi:hypothetical protein